MGTDHLLCRIEEMLIAYIPWRVKALCIREPVYCLRIWYYGTDTYGDRNPSLTLKAEALRRQLLADKGDKAPHSIWCADECEDGPHVFHSTIEDASISGACHEWYNQLPERTLPDDNDLLPLRETIQRVAARLNRLKWRDYASVTDDFVVIPADGSHSFCDDYGEMVASVPAERIELLRLRKLLGTDQWWTLGKSSRVDEV